MAKKVTIQDSIFNAFYTWFARRHREQKSLIADGFTRRHLRDAYEAGYMRGKRTEQWRHGSQVKKSRLGRMA